jgi:hypothetical protein
MIQTMYVDKSEISILYSLPLVQMNAPVLDINLEVREKVVNRISRSEKEKAFIDKKPIYKAKNHELF